MARFYGILLIATLVIVSGVIAYVGDVLGRRMGRKRLSLFGLRPRHTAIAISVIAGMLITLFTLGAAMVVSKDVQDGFLRVAQMRQERDALSQRLTALDGELREREEELEATRQAAEAQMADLAAVHAELRRTQAELDEAGTALREEQVKLARASTQVKKREALVDRQTQRLTKLQRDIDNLEKWRAWLTTGLVLERGEPILFGAGQPVAVELMDGKATTAEVGAQLDTFVSRMDQMVRNAGAAPLAGDDQAVVIGKPVPEPERDAVTWVSSEQVLEAVAEGVRESGDSVIVRAYSVMNIHKGEPVPIDFRLFHNDLVFRRGEALAETIIDGRLSSPALMEALVGLLRNEVGEKARAADVMPRHELGGSTAFGAPRESVGEMSFEELFTAVEELQRTGGPARVTAVAATDTWTIGPLKVRLVVAPVSGASVE